ncbi:MAG: FAD:protein FMN transferase [Fidelibacterota bacterium]
MSKKRLYIISLIILSITLFNCNGGIQKYSETRFKMGTVVQITVFEKDKETAYQQINRGFAEIDRIADKFWEGDPASEIYKFNHRSSDSVAVSSEVAALLSRAAQLSKNTGGAFDMTVGTLKNLYNFKKGEEKVPDTATVKQTLRHIGYDKLIINLEKNLLITDNQSFQILTGAIVKGYAAERAARVMAKNNKFGILINAGGDIRATKRWDDKKWIVGIQDPKEKGRLFGTVSIHEGAVVTSGDYEQYSVINGRRYHHIINPLTGFSAGQSHATTVIAPNAELADALATGLFVLGPDKGLKILEKYPDVECLWVDWDGNIIQSEGFKNFMD